MCLDSGHIQHRDFGARRTLSKSAKVCLAEVAIGRDEPLWEREMDEDGGERL
jgi:hypothetical protein